jgi:hypothetical protein
VLFEAGKETGGWIRSRRVNVEGYNPDPDKGTVGDLVEGSVVFELGPRTLRNATVTAGLVCQRHYESRRWAWLTGEFRFKNSASSTR